MFHFLQWNLLEEILPHLRLLSTDLIDACLQNFRECWFLKETNPFCFPNHLHYYDQVVLVTIKEEWITPWLVINILFQHACIQRNRFGCWSKTTCDRVRIDILYGFLICLFFILRKALSISAKRLWRSFSDPLISIRVWLANWTISAVERCSKGTPL